MANQDFDLNDARLFSRVVEKGSFSAAAKSMGLPVSSVSRKVARLEEQLGSRLLHRTTRKLSLTDAGETYHGMVSSALEQLDAAAAALSGLQSEPSGRIRFTTVPGLAHYSWELVEQFLERYSKVSIEMDLTERTVDLIDGGFDLALRAGQLPDSSLVSRRLDVHHFGPFASPEYLDAHGRPQTMEELSQHECIIRGLSLRGAHWRLTQGRKTRDVPVSGRLAITHLETVTRACIKGHGIALLPESLSQKAVDDGRLERVLPEVRGPSGGMYLVYPSRRQLSPSVRAFMDHLAENFDLVGEVAERAYARLID
jgi:DNA-binding transcriptional LysR family regulator